MFRSLVRSGIAALYIFLFLSSTPARALPPAGEAEAFPFLSALWEGLAAPIVALWTDPNGGGGSTTNGSGTCDPNGGDTNGGGC